MADGVQWLTGLKRALKGVGLNHIGVVSADSYDAVARADVATAVIAPGSRSVVVVASGGAVLWQAMVSACAIDPTLLLDTPHPLDDFVRRAVESATTGESHPWFYASHDATDPLDFRTLAVLAGLGAPSRLGLVIHERWGPWIGLRAAAFVPFTLPSTPPSPGLCTGCPAPCITACPGDAFVDGSWSVGRCAAFHHESDACATSCRSREACPVGVEHSYPPLERLYHYNRAAGRAALREHLGIAADRDSHVGSGPYWGAWKT